MLTTLSSPSVAGGLSLTQSPAYLNHRGRPAVIVWGLGFNDDGHPATPATAIAIQSFFRTVNVTLIGGVPTGWRTLTGDARPDPAWANIYLNFSVIHPWLVGRFPDDAGCMTLRWIATFQLSPYCRIYALSYCRR